MWMGIYHQTHTHTHIYIWISNRITLMSSDLSYNFWSCGELLWQPESRINITYILRCDNIYLYKPQRYSTWRKYSFLFLSAMLVNDKVSFFPVKIIWNNPIYCTKFSFLTHKSPHFMVIREKQPIFNYFNFLKVW